MAKVGRKKVKDKATLRLKLYYSQEEWNIIEKRASDLNIKPIKYVKWCINKDLMEHEEKSINELF